MTLYEELKWRGLVEDITDKSLIDKLNNDRITFYIGTDPTGDSLHIGHYSSFLVAKRLKEHGHNPILLVGGATGLIGDPKPNSERPMITKEKLNYNYEKLAKQVKEIFNFEVVNNYDWSKDINFIDYLRDYGKYFNLNYMLNKETVKSRLDIGITYTEFSYMIMQALDFLYLYENKNCLLQLGGSDQWGNITSGIELIRKKTGKEAYGMTIPLITKADGTKFGKSESGESIWLDKTKTSSYKMYQFFLNTEDEKVIEYLKKLTFLSKEEIEVYEREIKDNPEERKAQKALAREVITFLHGNDEYEHAIKLTESLFKNEFKDMDGNDIKDIFSGEKVIEIEENQNIIDLLINMNIANSKREGRELVQGNAISVNGDKITDTEYVITSDNFIKNTYIIVKKGKKNYFLGKKSK